MLAGATRLTRRIPAINLDERASIPPGFVYQLAHELAPTHIADGFGERVVLDHVLDRKALDAHHLVFADDACRELVLVVPPPVGDAGMDTGHGLTSLCPVTAALLLFDEPTLGLRQFLLIPGKIPGIANGLAGREHDHRCKSQVEPDHRVHHGQRRNLLFDQERDEVAVGSVLRDGHGRRLASRGKRTAPPDSERLLHLGEREVCAIPREGGSSVLCGLLLVFFLEDGVLRASLEEVLESAVEVPQGLLSWHTGNLTEKGVVGETLELGEQGGGLVVPERLLFLEVGLLSQVQEVVVDEAHAAKRAGKYALLLVRWGKAVSIGSFVFRLHTLLFFSPLRKVERARKERRRFLPSRQRRGVSMPQF